MITAPANRTARIAFFAPLDGLTGEALFTAYCGLFGLPTDPIALRAVEAERALAVKGIDVRGQAYPGYNPQTGLHHTYTGVARRDQRAYGEATRAHAPAKIALTMIAR